jgi:uncharacterized membrane protein
VFSIGVVFSHYSTSYVFLGTLILGWVFYKMFAALRFVRANGRGAAWPRARKMVLTPSVSLLNVVILVAGIGLWNGLATHTVGGFGTTLVQAVESLRGGTDTGKSEDVSYSLFGGGAESDSQVMDQYEKSTMNQPDATRKAEGFYTSAELAKYKYPLVSVPLENLPVTTLGNAADSVGVNVGTLNSALRSGSSKLLQLFVLLGLLSAFVRARKRGSVWITELIALALGAFVIVALQVVLPVISADYGVLRAFQQALISFGPLVAVGSLAIFRFLPVRWGPRAAFAVALVFFLSLVGVIPQLTGGYPAQLNLNNSGQYYDLYYTQPQEITALAWLQSSIPSGKGQPEVQMNPYAYAQLQTFSNLSVYNNDFPTLLQKNAYIFLGYQTVTTGQSTLFQNGDLISYAYPIGLLNSSLNLVYSSNGAKIYG